jgi:hypothetical protein
MSKLLEFQHGVAKIIEVTRDNKVIVSCPFCGNKHSHSRQSLGSGEVVAGCHKGYNRCLSYAIPNGRRR